MSNLQKLIFGIVIFCFLAGIYFVISELYISQSQKVDKIVFEVKNGETAGALAERLKSEGVIRNLWLFKKYLVWKGIDKKINIGEFEVQAPITLARVAQALAQLGLNEQVITIIPGWDLSDIAEYFEKEEIAKKDEFYKVVGRPAVDYRYLEDEKPSFDYLKFDSFNSILDAKPQFVSFEGYLAPNTYRIFKNATVEEIVDKLINNRLNDIDPVWHDVIKYNKRTFFEVLTMASILEKEVKFKEDRAKVADILWRRYDKNWALQVDSSVHYALGKKGEVFTTKEERDVNSPWNTYKYPGLPLGPICNPSLDSIKSAIYPEENKYWYFLTAKEGKAKYAETLEEHNLNRQKYLQ